MPTALVAAGVPERLGSDLHRVRLGSRLGLDVVTAKLGLLRDQLRYQEEGDPVERVGSRLKSVESIVAKARRKGVPLAADEIQAQIVDIAGVRAVCRFASDLYRLRDLMLAQPDVTLLAERDYVAHPKPSGYRSLHVILQVPVLLPGRVDHAAVELQLRTAAMDQWARLEHQLCYKGQGDVPRHVRDSLKVAADTAWSLDLRMEQLHHEARGRGAGTLSDATPVPTIHGVRSALTALRTRSAPASAA